MTLPPLREAIEYWVIAIDHADGFNCWPIRAEEEDVYVSARGNVTRKHPAMFRTRMDADLFFQKNETKIEAKCANKFGFLGFRIAQEKSYWPIVHDEPKELPSRAVR